MITYSFIIPHKNVPLLLKRCLDSIPKRADVEILVIDDCSDKDRVEFDKIKEEYKSCIRFFELKESHGAGYARNVGLSNAKGKWLLFADADDFYTDHISSILDKYTDDESTDIVYLNAQNYSSNGEVFPSPFSKYIHHYLNHKLYSEKVLRFNMWTPWTRMVKKKVVDSFHLKFEEVSVGNDKRFCLECSKYAKVISAEKCIVYNYFVPNNRSLTSSYYLKPGNLRNRLEQMLRTNLFYEEVGYTFKSSLVYYYLRSKSSSKTKEVRRIYQDVFSDHSVSLIKDCYYMLKQIIGRVLGLI